jgi:hypothetical protein
MLHDECAFLCSTIVSRRRHPAKAVDGIIELVTMLSSRKTRSILWQGDAGAVGQDDETDRKLPVVDGAGTPTTRPLSLPTPKVWASILDIIAVMTQQEATVMGNTSRGSSGNVAKGNADNKAFVSNRSPKKARTKSARRKQREMMQGAGVGAVDVASVMNSSVGSSVRQRTTIMPEMKEALACLVHILSWDCTLSEQRSVASKGAYQLPSLARRARLAILEHGSALAGIMRLMMPSEPTTMGQKPTAATNRGSGSAPGSPIPATSRKRSLVSSSSPGNNSMSSVSFAEEVANKPFGSAFPSKGEDLAKLGRKNRLKRKLRAREAVEKQGALWEEMATIPETVGHGADSGVDAREDLDGEMMPPPSKRAATKKADDLCLQATPSALSSGNLSFPASSAKKSGSSHSWESGYSMGSDATGLSCTISARASQKLAALRSMVQLDALAGSHEDQRLGATADDVGTNLQKAFYFERPTGSSDANPFPPGDYPWVTMVCLESLSRIVSGKEEGGKSCLEGQDSNRKMSQQDNDSDLDEDVSTNPIVVTNRLIGKSGVVPLLSAAMRHSMVAANKLIFGKGRQVHDPSTPAASAYDETMLRDDDEECWKYCQDRLSLLASLIDGASLLFESNRRGFCEEDPFAFEEQKNGLIFHILMFLRQCSQSDLSLFDEKRSETMLLALRMLTSLTHDNELAAEQMVSPFKDVTAHKIDFDRESGKEIDVRGIEILAKLIFQLEDSLSMSPSKSRRSSLGTVRRATNHDIHRYDSTIFCLNTLANVAEGEGVRKILTEITVQPESLGSISWLKWLCQWFVQQTETFQDEIMSIGTKIEGGASCAERRDASSTSRQRSKPKGEDFQKHEEEKLVAAGNCCVVLACLMIETETDDPEYSTTIRKVILSEMPFARDGKSTGVAMIINTLKAFCNYYHLSLGEFSLAVIAPVKQLIMDLEDMDLEEDDDRENE